ncbi:hypothetical protein ACFPRL_36635 [Pseudoclavibacter helvolus]
MAWLGRCPRACALRWPSRSYPASGAPERSRRGARRCRRALRSCHAPPSTRCRAAPPRRWPARAPQRPVRARRRCAQRPRRGRPGLRQRQATAPRPARVRRASARPPRALGRRCLAPRL